LPGTSRAANQKPMPTASQLASQTASSREGTVAGDRIISVRTHAVTWVPRRACHQVGPIELVENPWRPDSPAARTSIRPARPSGEARACWIIRSGLLSGRAPVDDGVDEPPQRLHRALLAYPVDDDDCLPRARWTRLDY